MLIVNCALVGDKSCGKSCMITRYYENRYRPLFVDPTFINEVQLTKEVDGNWCDLFITDISGNDGCLKSWISPRADVILVCFSIGSIESFRNVRDIWISKVREDSNAPIILVGTKLDVRSKVNTVTYNQGVKMAQEIGATMYLECSSAMGDSVDKVFNNAVRVAVESKFGQLKTKSSCLLQ